MGAQDLRKTIDLKAPGEVFSLKGRLSAPAARKALSRLEEAGKVARISGAQGLYYVPKKGALGIIKPKRGDLIKALIGPEASAYRSGISLYNSWGLTTQVPGEVTIVSERWPRRAKVGSLNVEYRRARAPITESNIPLLQLLDALSDIKDIPDATPSEVVSNLKPRIKAWSKEQVKLAMKLVRKYPPGVRALLGALLEEVYGAKTAKPIRLMQNAGSVYQIGVTENALPLKEKWNIL